MKKSKRSKSRLKTSPKLLVALAILLIVLIAAYLIFNHKSNNDSTTEPSASAKAQAAADSKAKKELIESKGGSTSSTPTPPGSPSNQADTGSEILDLSAKQETNNTVTILTKLSNAATGSCALQISNGAKSNNQSANIIYQPEFSTCEGFSVPISSLGSGNWSIKLSTTNSTKTITLGVTQ